MNIFCFDDDIATERLLKKIINCDELGTNVLYWSEHLELVPPTQDNGGMVVFLNTRLCEKTRNSFHFAVQIRESYPESNIIFISQYPEDIHLCLKHLIRPSGFLLKPILSGEVMDILREIARCKKTTYVRISTREYKYNIDKKQILFFSTFGKKLYAQMKNGEKIEFYGTISDLEKEHEDFIRCHNGFLVNGIYIKGIKKGELELFGYGETLPISQKYREKISAIKKG